MSGGVQRELRSLKREPSARSLRAAMMRGARKACPECGIGRLFAGYTKTRERCSHCGLDLEGHRADDAPPYVTIVIVGHLAIPLALAVKQIFDPPLGLQFAVWAPAMILAMIWLLPISKGALIGLQWANRMHGFGDRAAADRPDPAVLDTGPGVV
ncbi:MAG TPA: DUF983 domain-containing protein [Parvularculaceae bacterium]|nr:DUF983 domain-containing protein [Parvularculaceae bacterium]